MHNFLLSIKLFDVIRDWEKMLFDELLLKGYWLNLDAKKTCYPHPVKINIMFAMKDKV